MTWRWQPFWQWWASMTEAAPSEREAEAPPQATEADTAAAVQPADDVQAKGQQLAWRHEKRMNRWQRWKEKHGV